MGSAGFVDKYASAVAEEKWGAGSIERRSCNSGCPDDHF